MARCVFDIYIDFAKSRGSYIYDKRSQDMYLDLFSMFSSLPLGYNHPIFDDKFDNKIKHISHLRMSNNLFHSDELEEFESKLKAISIHHNFHFCSTGALAVESALKCAYEYTKKPQSIVVGLKNSYHGINSWGFITDSGMESVANRVENYPKNNWKNIHIAEISEFIEKNKNIISSVIVEPIQCTAGDIYVDVSELIKIQGICNKNNICLIVDEIQTGFGSTGEYWYSNKIGLSPDILVFGKKSQVCGIMVNDQYSEAIHSKYRKLQVTFDGELIDAVRACFIIEAIEKYDLFENVRKNTTILQDELSGLFDNYRSAGHLIAFDFSTKDARDKFVANAYDHKILVNPTSAKSVRLRPNLAFTKNEMDDFLYRIKKITK